MKEWKLNGVTCDECGELAKYSYADNLNAYYEENLCEDCAWEILLDRIRNDFYFEEVIDALGYSEHWGKVL